MSDYTVTVEPVDARIRVSVGGRVLADTRSGLVLHETDHADRYYVPRADVDLSSLEARDHSTTCPVKGVASDYWALPGAPEGEYVAWSYPDPIPSARAIAGHIAFYDEHVAVEVTP